MERLKKMGLKKSFVLLSAAGVAAALFLIGGVFIVCGEITSKYPSGGVAITGDGVVRELTGPTEKQKLIVQAVEGVRLLLCVLVPMGCLSFASMLFYRWKLKKPIAVLQAGTTRIREHDLDFTLPEVSGDELGQVCAAFETMRAELLQTNRELWRQAEERKRLNAAFSHDLRNPLTVLKGTVKLLRQGEADEHALERMETYVLRLEQYVEAMSSIQRLEQMPVQKKEVALSLLRDEVEETARLLAPGVRTVVLVAGAAAGMKHDIPESDGHVSVDHGLFLTVAENLIGNAARYARENIRIDLSVCDKIPVHEEEPRGGNKDEKTAGDVGNEKFLIMTVSDDGHGYPPWLVQDGPKPFGKAAEGETHFGMGLYSSKLLCKKHGGELFLENEKNGGAGATAVFQVS